MKPKKPEAHVQLLGTIFLVLQKVRRDGLMSIEGQIDCPMKSLLFTAFAPFDESNAMVYTVLCDAMRLMVGGNFDTAAMTRYFGAARKTSGLSSSQRSLFDAMEMVVIASLEGCAPSISVEFGRQCIPAKVKPSFVEFEDFLRSIRTATTSVMTREESDAALVSFFDCIAK